MKKWFIALGLAFILAGCAPQKPTITVGGSTAMQPLLNAAAKAYTAASVKVHAGDSAAGLNHVNKRRWTIGASDVFAQQQPGVNAAKLVDHQIAVTGIAPVVNPQTGVHALTTAQLRQLFAGQITNWQQVGGKDLKVTIVSRTEGSGTLANFRHLALADQPIAADVAYVDTAHLRQAVRQKPGAIGFLPFGAVRKGVVAVALDGVTPTAAHVITNRWPLWAYAHLYTNGSPDAATAKFIHYLQTAPKLAENAGYIPIRAMQVARTHDGMIEDTH